MGDESAVSGEESKLQFDKAEFDQPKGGASCAICKKEIPDAYYEINGQVACGGCCEEMENMVRGGSGAARFWKATVFGLAAGIIGFGLWFAVAHFMHIESGLVAIVVGLLVGAAVKRGSEGRGGWAYQALAMFITYSAIVSTYIPPALIQVRDEYDMRKATSVSTQDVSAQESSGDTAASLKRTAFLIIMAGFLYLMAFVAPIAAGLQNILGIIIIAIALYEAWMLNKKLKINISGPYQVAAVPPDMSQAAP